jgi:hypothetical protein
MIDYKGFNYAIVTNIGDVVHLTNEQAGADLIDKTCGSRSLIITSDGREFDNKNYRICINTNFNKKADIVESVKVYTQQMRNDRELPTTGMLVMYEGLEHECLTAIKKGENYVLTLSSCEADVLTAIYFESEMGVVHIQPIVRVLDAGDK